jgi:hypothetical protein
VKAYKQLRPNAITAFWALLKKDAKFRVVVRDWLTEGGVTDKYMLDSLIEPEDPYVRASRHRGSWAGFIHMASEWSSTFQGLVVVARLYDQFMADHPSLILVGGAFTPRMCEVVTKDIRALAKANVEWPIFLITSPGGRVSDLAALDDVYLSHGFRGRTCWCIDMAASCGVFLWRWVTTWTSGPVQERVQMSSWADAAPVSRMPMPSQCFIRCVA